MGFKYSNICQMPHTGADSNIQSFILDGRVESPGKMRGYEQMRIVTCVQDLSRNKVQIRKHGQKTRNTGGTQRARARARKRQCRAPWYSLRQHKLETSPAGRSEAANVLPATIRFGSEIGQGPLAPVEEQARALQNRSASQVDEVPEK